MRCECGCGQEVNEGRRFVRGHHTRCMSDKTRKKISDAGLGRKLSEEHRRKIGERNKGKNLGNSGALGRKHTEADLKKMRGRKYSREALRKMSEAQRGEKGNNWQGGISSGKYCYKFNSSFKESVRDKFGRVCFICGTPENGRKLSVHHVNYDKSCLCSEIKCEFVPLCMSCHGKTSHNREYYENLILEKLEELN